MALERVNFKRKVRIGLKVLKAGLLKQYVPLTVGFSLTRRCNLSCHYCTYPNDLRDELSTAQIISILDELKDLGTEQITYTGGEPLLRKDFEEIIDYTYQKNILSIISTNGLLIPQAITPLRKTSQVVISLDGTEEANTASRAAPGAYAKITEAIRLCQSQGIRVMLSTVISQCNVSQVKDVLDIAEKFNVKIIFQPAMTYRLGKKDKNPIVAEPDAYKMAMQQLIQRKIAGDKSIFNSLATLEHLSHWPTPTSIKCWASKLHCRIDCNGDLYPCGRMENRIINCAQLGVAAAFRQSAPDPCKNCWCANMVEFNHIASFNWEAMMNMLRNNTS